LKIIGMFLTAYQQTSEEVVQHIQSTKTKDINLGDLIEYNGTLSLVIKNEIDKDNPDRFYSRIISYCYQDRLYDVRYNPKTTVNVVKQ